MTKPTASNGWSRSIGDLARSTGSKVETIRYYERIGLLHEPPRTSGGYRVYDDAASDRLGFIRRARELGFTIDDVRTLLGLVDGGDYTCAEVQTIAVGHLQEIRSKIADLQRMEAVLAEMSEQCSGGRIPDCPVIDALSEGGPRTD